MADRSSTSDIVRNFIFMGAIYLFWLALSYGVLLVGPLLEHWPGLGRLSFLLSTIIFILVAFIITIGIIVQNPPVKGQTPSRRYMVGLALCLEVPIVLAIYAFHYHSNAIFMANTINLIILAVWTGTWLAGELRRPPEIVLLCIAMSLADLFSLYAGPTMHIASHVKKFYQHGMAGPVPLGDLILIKVPAPLVNHMLPVVGVADWIIITFLAGAVAKFKLDENLIGGSLEGMIRQKCLTPYLPISFLTLLLTLVGAQVFNLFLPVLPIIALFFLSWILCKYPQTRLTRKSDRMLILKFTLLMAVCFALLKYSL